MKNLVVILGFLLAPSLLLAESIRCGSQLILKGSTTEDLLAYCGNPTQVTRNGTTHGLVGNTYRGSGVIGEATGDIVVETWTYDFGSNQLMQRIRIENGIVVQIDSLGYGHDQP